LIHIKCLAHATWLTTTGTLALIYLKDRSLATAYTLYIHAAARRLALPGYSPPVGAVRSS
jgi:hypothetical protein